MKNYASNGMQGLWRRFTTLSNIVVMLMSGFFFNPQPFF